MPPAQHSIGSVRDQLHRFLTVVRRTVRYWWVVGIVCVLGGGVTLAFVLQMKRTYASRTILSYTEQESLISNREQVGDNAARVGQRLRDMLLARPRMETIVKDFGMYPDVVKKFGLVEAVDELKKHIEFRMPGGESFHIGFQGPTPEIAKNVTERLAQALQEDNRNLRVAQSSSNKQFLEEQKKLAEDDLNGKEKAYSEFLAKNPEYAVAAATSANARGAEALRNPGPSRPTTTARFDPRLDRLERERNNLKAALGMPVRAREADPRLVAELQDAEEAKRMALVDFNEKKVANLGDAHPDMKAALGRVSESEGRVKRAREAVARSEAAAREVAAEVDKAELGRRLTEVEAAIRNYRARTGVGGRVEPMPAGTVDAIEKRIAAVDFQYQSILRDVTTARESFDTISRSLSQAEVLAKAEATGRAAQLIIVDPAFTPTRPAGKGRGVMALAGLAVSLLLGLGVAVLFALVDDRIYDRFDVEKLELAPLLIVVPRSNARGRRLV